MSSLRAVAVGAALALAAVAAEAQSWRSLGPAPISDRQWTGRAAALALSPTRRSHYWVGAASGGVWRSKNGGGRWAARTDSLPTLAIGALALDPNNGKVLYAGSGEANYAYHSLYGLGLYKSTDRGKSWRVLAADTFAGRTFSRLVVSSGDGDEVWAAVARAGGTHRGFEGARRHPRRQGRMGIFRSRDGGESWTAVRNGLPRIAASDLDLDPADPARVFASFGQVFGAAKNGIYRSTDGGERFRKLPIGLGGRAFGRVSLAIAPSEPRRIYALVTRPASRATSGGFSPGGASTLGVLRSDDGGDSWTLLNAGNPQSSAGHYYSAIAVHPRDPDTFVIGGLNLLASTDGGAGYRDITPPHVDIHDAGWDAAGRLVVATDGGVHRSTDLGRTWSNRNRGLGSVQFYPGLALHPRDPEIILGGTQDNGTNLRLGSGNRWVHIAGGDGGWSLIDPENPSVLFIQFQGTGNIFRSPNGGFSFSAASQGIAGSDRTAFQAPLLFDPNDSSRLFYATQRIYESVDGGSSWTAISPDLAPPPWAVRSLAVAPSDSSVLYAVTSEGAVLASGDGGRSFRRGASVGGWPRITRQIAVDPTAPERAWVADMRFGGAGVLATSDRGASWASVAGDLPDVPVNAIAVAARGDERTLVAGTDAGVYTSYDGGATWQRYGDGLPNAPVIDILVDAPRQRLVAATLGRGVWSAPLTD